MHYSFSELPTSRKRRNIEVSHFGNLENKQKMRGVHRLHQLNMRIFKVKKSHEKSRRYVKQRIYGFSVSSDICTFVWNCQEMCSRRIPKIMDMQVSGGMMSQPC